MDPLLRWGVMCLRLRLRCWFGLLSSILILLHNQQQKAVGRKWITRPCAWKSDPFSVSMHLPRTCAPLFNSASHSASRIISISFAQSQSQSHLLNLSLTCSISIFLKSVHLHRCKHTSRWVKQQLQGGHTGKSKSWSYVSYEFQRGVCVYKRHLLSCITSDASQGLELPLLSYQNGNTHRSLIDHWYSIG